MPEPKEVKFPSRAPLNPNGGRPTNEKRNIPKQERLVLYLPLEHHQKVREFAQQFKSPST